MITYKYKLYNSKRNRHLQALLREACFVWNHCLALQRRYYAVFGKYCNGNKMKKHFAKRYKMQHMHSQSVQEVIERLDIAYQRFFSKKSARPPKFKKSSDFASVVYKQGGFTLQGNAITINKLARTFRFSLSRPYSGNVKRLSVKRSPLGEYYVTVVTDAEPKRYGKTHNGASIGIDFGLKTYMTFSDGTRLQNPRFLNRYLPELRRASRQFSKAHRGSNNREQKKEVLLRCHEKVSDSRRDYQWKLAHEVCKRWDNIFIEDIDLRDMCRRWGRKMSDLGHGEFVSILESVAAKYGCRVHRIDRWYPSSRLCPCGYRNDSLTLSDREWTCPECGVHHDRDVLAARNILRQGIAESESENNLPPLGAAAIA